MAVYIKTLVGSLDIFLRKIDPLLRLPLIFALDSSIQTMNFDNVSSWLWTVSAMVVGILLFLLMKHEHLRFIYGCGIGLHIFIPTLFFFGGHFVPFLQNMMHGVYSKYVMSDALRYYLLTLGILKVTKNNQTIPKSLSLTIPMALLHILTWHYKFSFIFGYMFYFIGELLGVHILFEKAFIEAASIVKLVGPFNTTIYYGRQRKLPAILRLFYLLTVLNILYLTKDQFELEWVLIAAAASCNSRLRLIAMSLWLPEVSYYTLWVTRGFLSWTMSHNALDLERRDLSKAVIFFAIASVNHVTTIDVVERILFLSILMFISFSYILSSVYTLIDVLLKSLSTSMRAKGAAHIRALSLMLFLIWLLVYTSYTFCMSFPLHVWQLVVVSSNIVTAVHALSSLVLYALFMYESKVMIIDEMDEWIYRITAFSNTCEFLSAVLIMGFGVCNVIKGVWNVAGLLIIGFHAYYNLWLKAREAWTIFLGRRSAVVKLNRLTDATKEQLDELKDLCPICFEAMEAAKITQCSHYFHANCLRKWLYIKTTCPLCHQDVVMTNGD